MDTFFAILRGINVSGKRKILMADLKLLLTQLDAKEIATYIQSGNVVFKHDSKSSEEAIAAKIEAAIFKKYHFEVPVLVRTNTYLNYIIAQNPFLKDSNINKDKLHVTFLSQQPKEEDLEKLEKYHFPPDQFQIANTAIWLYCPDTYGHTKLSNTFFEKKLDLQATTRNWKTINKLLEMMNE